MKIDPRLNNIVAAQPYPLIFATISGAHLYGFPSPDSDYDLRGACVAARRGRRAGSGMIRTRMLAFLCTAFVLSGCVRFNQASLDFSHGAILSATNRRMIAFVDVNDHR